MQNYILTNLVRADLIEVTEKISGKQQSSTQVRKQPARRVKKQLARKQPTRKQPTRNAKKQLTRKQPARYAKKQLAKKQPAIFTISILLANNPLGNGLLGSYLFIKKVKL